MAIYWPSGAARRGETKEIAKLIGPDLAEEVGAWLDAGQTRARTHGPLAGCVAVLRAVLATDDRAERVACLLSGAILAWAMNWKTVLPVSMRRLTKTMLRDLGVNGQGAELAVQARILESIEETIRQARDLAQRGEALRAVAPKLRAKGSDAAVGVFLSEDAIAPSTMLSPMIKGTAIPMTDHPGELLTEAAGYGWTLVNAAFCYTRATGNRFNGPERGAWYASYGALAVETAQAEVAWHLTRELEATGVFENTTSYRELFAGLTSQFHQLDADMEDDVLSTDPTIAYPSRSSAARASDTRL